MSPTARSLAHLRELGCRVKVVEKWNPFAKVRQDLFGGDLLALKAGEPVLIIQVIIAATCLCQEDHARNCVQSHEWHLWEY